MIRTKRARSLKVIQEINITPFTDVCLVLLIIFMVTIPKLSQEHSMKLNLPKASTSKESVPTSVTVRITHDLKLLMNNEKVASFSELEAKIAAIHTKYGTRMLVVRGDEGIPYQYVITTIDIARKVGVDQIALATRQAH